MRTSLVTIRTAQRNWLKRRPARLLKLAESEVAGTALLILSSGAAMSLIFGDGMKRIYSIKVFAAVTVASGGLLCFAAVQRVREYLRRVLPLLPDSSFDGLPWMLLVVALIVTPLIWFRLVEELGVVVVLYWPVAALLIAIAWCFQVISIRRSIKKDAYLRGLDLDKERFMLWKESRKWMRMTFAYMVLLVGVGIFTLLPYVMFIGDSDPSFVSMALNSTLAVFVTVYYLSIHFEQHKVEDVVGKIEKDMAVFMDRHRQYRPSGLKRT